MSKKDNLRRVLAPFLRDPTKSLKRKDLSPIFEDMSWDLVQKALQNLEKDEILTIEFLRGRPKGGEKTKNYKINGEISTFIKLFQLYFGNNIEDLFSSKYTDSIIKKFHLEAIFDIIELKLEVNDFRKIASKTLLIQPSTLDEYNDKSKFINEFISLYSNGVGNEDDQLGQQSIDEMELWNLFIDQLAETERNINCHIRPIHSKRIDMLTKFDPIEAVYLYRNTMYKDIKEIFSDLSAKSIITQGLSNFMKCDSYLSPFTSYPNNHIGPLLFGRPFQRIYDDMFLLNEGDISKALERTFVIYNNFGEILFEYFRNNLAYLDDLELYTRQFIFQWNVARTNFDYLWDYLSGIYDENIGSGKFYVYLRGAMIKVNDLKTNEFLPFFLERKIYDDELKEELVIDTISPPIINNMFSGLEVDVWNPYEYAISSFWFRDMDECPTVISFDEIISDTRSAFAKYGWNVDDVERNLE